jgi:hypothetical protein
MSKLLFILLFLTSCSICRVQAVKDAEFYKAKGFKVQIATYDLKLDGLLYGAFIWTHHTQAVVWIDNEQKWVGSFGLSHEPTFRTGRIIVYQSLEEFKLLLSQYLQPLKPSQ